MWSHTRRFLPLKQMTAAFWLAALQPASEYPGTWRPNPSPVPGFEPPTCQTRLSPESREAQNGAREAVLFSCPPPPWLTIQFSTRQRSVQRPGRGRPVSICPTLIIDLLVRRIEPEAEYLVNCDVRQTSVCRWLPRLAQVKTLRQTEVCRTFHRRRP